MAGEQTFEDVVRAAHAYQQALLAVDPALLDGAACERLLGLVTRVQRTEAVTAARCTRRATQANRWRTTGDRSPGDWLARHTGTTPGRARRDLTAADDLAAAPATEQALADGRLSPEQAAEIAAAARIDPDAEAHLLAAAPTASLAEVQRHARTVRAAATNDTARREQIHRHRHLRHWTDPDGAFCFTGRGLPEHGAALLAALKPHHDAAATAARRTGRQEPADAHAYDALLHLLTTRPTQPPAPAIDTPDDPGAGDGDSGEAAPSGTRRAPAQIIVTADLSALQRGRTRPGETCEIAGIGPVAVTAARDLLGDAFLALVLTDGVDIRNVTHLGRAPTAHQRTALEARGRICAVPGCGRTTRLEIDHVQDWAITRRTHIDHLDWLCAGVGGHHHRKTHDGWTLTGPPGDRTWHPPPHRDADPALADTGPPDQAHHPQLHLSGIR